MTDKIDISAEAVDQAVAELRDVTRCRCAPAYTDRGLHDPQCECDSAEAVEVLAARLAEVEEERDSIMETLVAARVEMTKAITRAEAAEALLPEAVKALINIERIYYMEAANPDPATIRRMAAQMNGVANTVLSSLSLESEEVARIMMAQAVRETQK